MAGNSIGQLFRVTTCGESHGVGLMAIVDGVPPGIELSAEDLQKDLDRRKPGTSKFATQRKEPDEVEIISSIVSAMVEQRTSLGLSQRELAAMCGIPQSSVARIESCKTTPNLGTLLNIFQHLGLQLTVRPTKPTV